MTPVACRYCGLPFKVRRVEPAREYFCCTGCAMLARVPVDAQGQFPVNGHLIAGLSVGFLYFNQLLFWLLQVLLAHEGKQDLAGRFGLLAIGAAFVVWLAAVVVQWREKAFRFVDLSVAILVLIAHGWMALATSWSFVGMALANAALLGWSARGLLRVRRK